MNERSFIGKLVASLFMPLVCLAFVSTTAAGTEDEKAADAAAELEEEIPHSIEVDTTRLIIQWVTILFVFAAVLYLTKEKEEDFDEDYDE